MIRKHLEAVDVRDALAYQYLLFGDIHAYRRVQSLRQFLVIELGIVSCDEKQCAAHDADDHYQGD